MNTLIVGKNKSDISTLLAETRGDFLLIDDGTFSQTVRARRFDISKHCFNPLRGIDRSPEGFRRAELFLDILSAAFPAGENTLTKANGLFRLLQTLTTDKPPTRLDDLVPTPPKGETDTGLLWAYQKTQRLLLSPVLNAVLNGQMDAFPFTGTVTVTLNPAELSDTDRFVLGNLIIAAYQGQIIVPDFGFYACPSHVSLMREHRLIAGVNFLDEAKELRPHLLLMERKLARQCIAADAVTLAQFEGLVPDTTRVDNPYNEYVRKAVGA